MAGAGLGRMRKTKSGQETGEEVRAVRPNHRDWALRSESLENSVLCIWRAGIVPKGSQGLRWEERAGLDPSSPPQPRFSKVQAWAAASNRHSLDHPVFLVPGPEQESQASLSWKSGCLAHKTLSAQLRALESLTLRLRIQRSAEFSFLT